jgi:biopolymer transport protein ExbD
MTEYALSAPFFERLGYGLAIAAFAILALGVMWRLTQTASDSYRVLFRILLGSLIVKVAIALFFLLRFTVLVDRSTIPSYPQPLPNHSSPATDSPRVSKALVLELTPDGDVLINGEQQTLEVLEAQITLASDRPDRVTIKPHALTPWAKVVQLSDTLQRLGIRSISYQTEDGSKESLLDQSPEEPSKPRS